MLFLNEKMCIDFLEKHSYYVYKLYDIDKLPKDCVELTKYFFSLARIVYDIPYESILWKVEFAFAKTFIKQMSQDNNPKDKLAISQCKYVVDTVFNNLDLFEKYYRVDSLKIFAAEKNYWVIEKCAKLDGKGIRERTGYTQKDWDLLNREYENFTHESLDVEKIKLDLINMLGDAHGKEKNS